MPLSIVQLVEAHSLDAQLAALLCLMLERRASVLVAASAPSAGKTATLTALLDFLAPGTRLLFLRGRHEDFSFHSRVEPHTTYLLCNEISPDLPEYLWGPRVAELFGLLAQGYAVGTSMHADSLEEVVDVLLSPPLSVPRAGLGQMTLVVLLQLRLANGRLQRRLSAVYFLRPGGRDEMPRATRLASWDETTDGWQHASNEVREELAQWLRLTPDTFRQELAARAQFLQQLVESGADAIPAVRQAVALYRGQRVGRGAWWESKSLLD